MNSKFVCCLIRQMEFRKHLRLGNDIVSLDFDNRQVTKVGVMLLELFLPIFHTFGLKAYVIYVVNYYHWIEAKSVCEL